MLTIAKIRDVLRALNDELAAMEVIGELGLCGGAVMCLVFHARPATKDIDGIFVPTKAMRAAARRVAKKFNLAEDWLNDAAKAYFHVDPPREPVLQLSHLRVWAPRADYMLAMKCVAARYDTHDRDDILFLIHYLGLTRPEAVFALVEQYYPHTRVPAKTQFAIEELMAQRALPPPHRKQRQRRRNR